VAQQLGLVVHPTRSLDTVLESTAAWAHAHGANVGQVRIPGLTRQVADPVDPADCEILLSLGGDGTALHALRAGAPAKRPVLGIACGSVGVLTSVTGDHVAWALDQFAEGRWRARAVPGLAIASSDGPVEVVINDMTLIRDGPGQVVIAITVDDVLYVRVAGDGVVVATALGSSAYSMAAGGPILAPGVEGMVVTPLAPHGGSAPPLVTGPSSTLRLEVEKTYSRVRYDVDGRSMPRPGDVLTVHYEPEYAVLVELSDQDSRLAGLRQRGLVRDGPRVLVRDRRVE
jgi:NAD+ kinase